MVDVNACVHPLTVVVFVVDVVSDVDIRRFLQASRGV